MFQVTQAVRKLLALRNRIKAVQGGTSAGKTIAILMILIDKAQTNPNISIDVMSVSYPHLEGGAIKDFKSIMVAQGYWKDERWNETKHFYTFEGGAVLKFISIDNLGKAKGPRRDVLFLNEANHISWEIVDQLIARTRGDVWMDWNPSSEFWYHEHIKDNPDYPHDFIILTYKDNEGLDQATIDYIEAHRDNKNWWLVYGQGLLGEVEGRVYTGWAMADEPPHEARIVRRGLDFGYTNDPTALIAVYEYNGGYIWDEELYAKGLSNKQIADKILNLRDPMTLVVADSAEPKSIDELQLYGVNIVPAQKGPGSINQGIQFIQGQRISLTRRSVNTKKEYERYMWMTDRMGRVINTAEDGFNHAMDAGRYAMSSLNPILSKKQLPVYAFPKRKF